MPPRARRRPALRNGRERAVAYALCRVARVRLERISRSHARRRAEVRPGSNWPVYRRREPFVSLVFAGVCSHAPGITGRKDMADPVVRDALYAGFERMRVALEAQK